MSKTSEQHIAANEAIIASSKNPAVIRGAQENVDLWLSVEGKPGKYGTSYALETAEPAQEPTKRPVAPAKPTQRPPAPVQGTHAPTEGTSDPEAYDSHVLRNYDDNPDKAIFDAFDGDFPWQRSPQKDPRSEEELLGDMAKWQAEQDARPRLDIDKIERDGAIEAADRAEAEAADAEYRLLRERNPDVPEDALRGLAQSRAAENRALDSLIRPSGVADADAAMRKAWSQQ